MKRGLGFTIGLVLISMAILLIRCGDAPQGNEGEFLTSADSEFDLEQSYAKAVNTTLKSWPANPSNSADATFKFKCNKKSCAYKCQLDANPWASCKSPKTYIGLSEGNHTFKVKAKDKATGKWDKTPASYSWTIDTTETDTEITAHPPVLTSSPDAIFEFSCNEANCTFECQLDDGGFLPCTSPASYSGLSNGPHTFEVRATDQLGHTDSTPATYDWTIDMIAPDTFIDAHPPAFSNSPDASFEFSSNEANCSFECQLDGGGFSPCTSPKTYSGLQPGEHTFQVRAIDPVGNTDLTPSLWHWMSI